MFRRMSPEELQKELDLFAESGKFSSPDISVGHVPERETHKKEFHRPLVLLSEKELTDLAAGRTIRNQDILLAQKLVCRTPQIPGTAVYEKKFSALELAFDDCPQKRLEIYAQYRKERDERALNKITPELRAQIKGSGIGTSATRAEILKKLVNIEYLALNKKTQVLTPTQMGEMIYDVVSDSIRPLLNPALTASWEKGLTMVADGVITPDDYMGKLTDFVGRRTVAVRGLNNQGVLWRQFQATEEFYQKKQKQSNAKNKE